MSTLRLCVAFLVAAMATLMSGHVRAAADEWVTLMYPDPAPGVSKTYCYGINDAGDAVGTYWIGTVNKAFLFSDGEYYSLHPVGATTSTAWGINARGDIVGDYYVGSQEHGFLLRKGVLTTIDVEGQAMAHLRGINARGDIAGSYMQASPTAPQHGFVLMKDGTFIHIDYPEAIQTIAFGINDSGDTAGEYKDAGGVVHGFMRTAAGDFAPLNFPNAASTSAQRINARGEIVGYYWDRGTPSVSHGFVLRGGTYEQADMPGTTETMLHGLNDNGESCGMMSTTPYGSPIQWGGFAHLR